MTEETKGWKAGKGQFHPKSFKRDPSLPPIDWEKLRTEYIETPEAVRLPLSTLAKKYQASAATVYERAKKEDWKGQCEDFWRKANQIEAHNQMAREAEIVSADQISPSFGDAKITETAVRLALAIQYKFAHSQIEAAGDPLDLLDIKEMTASLKTLQGIIHNSRVAESKTTKGQAADLKRAAEKDVESLLQQFRKASRKAAE